MSVPPQLIRVKRKATEEDPVSYLCLQESKRHRSGVFVYQRQDADAPLAESVPVPNQRPVVHTSPQQEDHVSRAAPARVSTAEGTKPPDPVTSSEPRRFHMSRKDMIIASTTPYESRVPGGVSKKRTAPALFVERRIKRISSRNPEKLHAAPDATPVAPEPSGARAPEDMEVDKPAEHRKFKKPGVSRLPAKDGQPKQKPELPKSMTNRWNVNMEQLALDMEAYALEQIGLNLQKAEEEKRVQEASASKLKFKPKPPAKRYAERHPEESHPSTDKEMVDFDAENSDSEGEYVIDTYIRVPASSMGDHVPPQKVGLLVFDQEPDIEFFYGEEDESEEEWAEDEEDENAENYYTADYPDEEVDTDDEYDKNPYAFRTGNASDLEEYDVVDDSDDDRSEEETETSQFRTYIGRNGLRSNHI
ncbi:hypothetical protein F5Y17DRAFT_95808 [Xylariaceae sp. FL0594]|nr:hypothetical protein F5Y17DRAFT_95808 [Xylariaceae sp. FL0594]